MEQKEITEKLEKEIEFIKNEKNFWIKRSMDLYLETIYQGRNLVRDVVVISTGVVAFVIPLLLNANINLDKSLLLISAFCFITIIIYGISLLLFVLKKELKNWPKTLDGMMEKMNKDILAIVNAMREPSVQNYDKALSEIAERHKSKKEEEKWWKKFINHDVGFYGLFFIAIFFLIISVFKSNIGF